MIQIETGFFYSRDVKFNESAFGFEKGSEPELCVQFDCDVDSGGDVSDGDVADCDVSDGVDVSDGDAADGVDVSDGDAADGDVSDGVDVSEPVLRTLQRVRQRPNYYLEGASIATSSIEEPSSVQEAVNSPNKAKWEQAMESEMRSLKENDVWELVNLPENRKVVGSKWVFKVKVHGCVDRYKARLVAQGFSQTKGMDYDETFCPVVRMESLRAIVGLAARNGLKLHQLDVITAFLNGKLDEEVYMRQPEGFVEEGNLVCRLKRSLYGLKQSPRCWNSALDAHLKKLGFLQSNSDPCIYVAAIDELMVVGVYVDNLVIGCKSDERLTDLKRKLCSGFDMKDLGKLHHFLGLKVIQDEESGNVWIGQPAYVEKVLVRYEMKDAKSVGTPVDVSAKLVRAGDGEGDLFDSEVYRSAVGSLLYVSTGTRPYIAFAVSMVAKFSSKPTKQHWQGVKRILRYLKGTADLGLLYRRSDAEELTG